MNLTYVHSHVGTDMPLPDRPTNYYDGELKHLARGHHTHRQIFKGSLHFLASSASTIYTARLNRQHTDK